MDGIHSQAKNFDINMVICLFFSVLGYWELAFEHHIMKENILHMGDTEYLDVYKCADSTSARDAKRQLFYTSKVTTISSQCQCSPLFDKLDHFCIGNGSYTDVHKFIWA